MNEPGSQTYFGLPLGFMHPGGGIIHPDTKTPIPEFGQGDPNGSRMNEIISLLWPPQKQQSEDTLPKPLLGCD